MNKRRLGLLIALIIAVCAFFAPSAAATPTAGHEMVAAASVTGADATPNPNPPGSADGDSDDWSGIPWLLLGLLIPVLFIGSVVLAKRRTHRDRSTD